MADADKAQLSAVAGLAVSHTRRNRPGRSRWSTLILVIAVAGIGYLVWHSSSKPPRPTDSSTENPIAGILGEKKPDKNIDKKSETPKPAPAESSKAPSPVPVELTPPKARPSVGPSGTHIESSADTIVQWADKNDPSRLAGEFSYKTLEPLESKRYSVQSPRAWMFMKDGWSVLVQAESGRVYIPDEQVTKRPESGTLRGNVTLKAFKPRPDRKRPDPEKDQPYMIATMDTLSFDGSIGELSTPDQVVADWEQGHFVGTGLTAIYNELASRVEFAEIKKGDELIIRPSKEKKTAAATTKQPATTTPAPSNSTPSVPSTATAAQTPTAESESQYYAQFASDVKITQGTRILTADQLELWARIVDGKFPADAFGPKTAKPAASAAPRETTSPAATPDSATPTTSTTPTSKPAETEDPNQADIRVTWTGPFTIRTGDTKFPQLEHDALAAHFSARNSGTVVATADDLRANARASSLDYFATRRQVQMVGDGANGVIVALEKSGTARASNLTADLQNGAIKMNGAGVLEGLNALTIAQGESADAPKPTITWSEQAELLLDQTDKQSRLREATFNGDVIAKDRDASIKGSFLNARFAKLGEESILQHATVQGNAIATDGKSGEISGDHLDADFAPWTHDAKTTPAIAALQARGNVHALHGKDDIRAGFLDTRFVTKDEKSGIVSTVNAKDDVRLSSTDAAATGAELNYNDLTKIATITGTTATPATASHSQTKIIGPALTMDSVGRTINADGPGTLTHTEPGKTKDAGESRITANWTESLAYDDRRGTADLAGNVSATQITEPDSLDLIKSSTLNLKFTEYQDPQPQAPGTAPAKSAPRELLTATAKGTETARASFESRRYDPTGIGPIESRKLERVNYLEGAQINVDNAKGTLDVPVPGKLLVSDRRPGAQAQSSGSFAGDALFTWTNSFTAQRAADTADMLGNVEVVHLRPGDADATLMKCDHVVATMMHAADPKSATTDTAHRADINLRGDISRILATGNVWARSATKREVTADIMDYNAPQGMMTLSGNNGREISAFDPVSGAPLRGRLLEWDLKLDRIRVKDVGGITVPR